MIGLKPTALDFYFPDLVLVESTLSETDPDSFALDSAFSLTIANRGTSTTRQDFTVVAFLDANGNSAFDPGLEPEVGRVRVDEDLPIGGSVDVGIAVTAQMAFRDAPVAFWVDAENEIPEQLEDNNVGTSLLGCRVTPAFVGNDNIGEFWRWEGLSTNPQINSLNATPSVIQLTDDNGDGVINEYDIPDLVFVAGRRNEGAPVQTALVALDGRTGEELWSRTDFRLSQFASPATGDIDNDGIAEIVVVRGYREELIAFENDGTLKWRAPLNGPAIAAVLLPPPPHVYDMPIIVNLEGDNEAEVVLGREAFRGLNGEQLWEGEFDAGGDGGVPLNLPLRVAFGIASVAADINLDGRMEVIAGRTAYDFEGRTLWHRDDIKPIPHADANRVPMNYSGYVAIGNFDLDDFAEIVLAIDDELWLLNHDGSTIWGPIQAPDFGDLGAPTVADIDDDGLPEIIISSNEKLTVFESDGTIKRTFDIEDSSGLTSATVFDFENDGLLEVVHMDEKNLRILDARTLVQRFITANTSRTVYEVPVIADIDGDKQAEIIITGYDDDLTLRSPGIRVFKARNGAWADAGSVWSAQGFHINEINEDSTLPLIETPSWLTHNTYRVQRSPLPDPLGMPDFSVGDLRLIDQGAGQNPAVQVRVGNAGPVDAHEPPYISVYRGDPAAGGVLLAETRLDTLRPARFQIVNLGEVETGGTGDLFAVVDQRQRARECREGNNWRSVPFIATNGRGDLQLSTDLLTYAPGTTAMLTANVLNQGAVDASYTVEWFVRNAQGLITVQLDPLALADVPSEQSANLTIRWSTQGVLAGNYVLEGRLRNLQGSLIDTATAAFAITGTVVGPAGAITLSTPRVEYAAGEAVRLDYIAQNLSSSEVIRLPEVVVDITGPDSYLHTRTIALDDLFTNSSFTGELGIDGTAAIGEYVAVARLRSRLTGVMYATDT
ncbi:MAG: FG-GAP-like repeat-containing protein, partial [Dokdonella sp.]